MWEFQQHCHASYTFLCLDYAMQEQSSGYDAMQQLQLINYFYFLHFLYISHYHCLFEIIKFEE